MRRREPNRAGPGPGAAAHVAHVADVRFLRVGTHHVPAAMGQGALTVAAPGSRCSFQQGARVVLQSALRYDVSPWPSMLSRLCTNSFFVISVSLPADQYGRIPLPALHPSHRADAGGRYRAVGQCIRLSPGRCMHLVGRLQAACCAPSSSCLHVHQLLHTQHGPLLTSQAQGCTRHSTTRGGMSNEGGMYHPLYHLKHIVAIRSQQTSVKLRLVVICGNACTHHP